VIGDLFVALNKAGQEIAAAPITPDRLGQLVGMIQAEKISGRIAKDVFQTMFDTGGDPEAIVAEQGLAQISDSGALEAIVDELITANPAQVASYQSNPKALGWFVGQVMKATKGQANPQLVNELLRKKLGA
jgi:aspartyl-tRNA(Asn)/glutamyl-tRNA(Gln) amidotransferase subunit B